MTTTRYRDDARRELVLTGRSKTRLGVAVEGDIYVKGEKAGIYRGLLKEFRNRWKEIPDGETHRGSTHEGP